MAKLTYNSRKTRVRINKFTGSWQTNTAPEKDGEWIEFTPFNYDFGNDNAKWGIIKWLDTLEEVIPDENGYFYIEAPLNTRTKEIIVAGEGNIAFVFHKLGGQFEITLSNMFSNALIDVDSWQRKQARLSKQAIMRKRGFTGSVNTWSNDASDCYPDEGISRVCSSSIEATAPDGKEYSCGIDIYIDEHGEFGYGLSAIVSDDDRSKPLYEWGGNFECIHTTRKEAEEAIVHEFWDQLHDLLTEDTSETRAE